MHVLKLRNCFGCIPLYHASVIITVFGLINKLSGIYGFISMDFEDPLAFMSYIYSIFALAAYAYGGYALKVESVKALRRYTLFYWFDLILNAVAAALFSVRWFVYTDHSLPENADDGTTEEQHEQLFKMESSVSIAILIILWLVHVYFGFVLTSYYTYMKRRNILPVPTSFDRTSEGFDDGFELDPEADVNSRGYKLVNNDEVRLNKLS